MSLLYEVLEPLPDAHSALERARGLLREFGECVDAPEMPELGTVVTVEQFNHARVYFARGEWRTQTGFRFPEEGLGDFWAGLQRLGVPRGDDAYRVEVDLTSGLATLWPLPAGIQLELERDDTLPFGPPSVDNCTEAEVDAMVAAVGPLAFEVQWYASLRGLPASKLCGVQLCINSVWTEGCSEPAPGNHAVYLSIGTKNRDVQDEWLRATGLSLGQALSGW
jgi:hypothetical protein